MKEVELKKNVPRAMNYAAAKQRTEIRKRIKSYLSNVKVRFLNQRIKVFKATRQNWAAAVFVSAKKIPLTELNFRHALGGSVYKFGAQKKIRKKAFLVKKIKGVALTQPVAFERKTKKRLPIRKAYETSLATLARRKKIALGAQKKMLALFIKELRRLNKAKIK